VEKISDFEKELDEIRKKLQEEEEELSDEEVSKKIRDSAIEMAKEYGFLHLLQKEGNNYLQEQPVVPMINEDAEEYEGKND